jgi:transcriptional regulator GlxA family with amidase domain
MLQFTSASVEEISTALGFANAAYFRKIFKSHTGTTPIKIRKDAKHI